MQTSNENAQQATAMMNGTLTKAERQSKRLRRQKKAQAKNGTLSIGVSNHYKDDEKEKMLTYLATNENELLHLVVKINRLYEQKLKKDAPFRTWVLVGMQSSGKSTFMERLLNAVVNIVQENTGTRCPLDVTCILDESCREAKADLSGEEFAMPGKNLSVNEVFQRITHHNMHLADLDTFSTRPIYLVY
jgi:Dynamin family